MSHYAGLNKRVRSGILLGGLPVLALLWAPAWSGVLIVMGLGFLAQREVYALMRAAGVPHYDRIGLAGGALLIGGAWGGYYLGGPLRAFEFENYALAAITLLVLVRQFPQRLNDQPLQTMAATLLGLLYAPFLINFISKILLILPAGGDAPLLAAGPVTGARLLLLYYIVVVKCSDIGAFFVGCRWGRHKLFPRLSPAKTWEGLAGGLGAAWLVSLLWRALCGAHLGDGLSLSWLDAALLAPLLTLTGVLGDLTESQLKRAGGAKDAGASIPGMGGLLDVLDSLIFAAPVAYLYFRFTC